jgi:hypothetical protein
MCATCIVTGVAYAAVPMSVYRYAVLRKERKPKAATEQATERASGDEAAEEESAPAPT